MGHELDRLAAGYRFGAPAVGLGRAVDGAAVATGFEVALPLAALARHGLVTGASGSGRTRTVQALAGKLSDLGVPCLVADLGDDLSGLAEPGEEGGAAAVRAARLGVPYRPHAIPVERLTLSDDPAAGRPVRVPGAGTAGLDVRDLVRTGPGGRGVCSLLGPAGAGAEPGTAATFLRWLLAALCLDLPEAAAARAPRLVVIVDEAQRLLDDGPPDLAERIGLTLPGLGRQGVGVFLVTRSPADLPATVLARLGNRVLHAPPGDDRSVRAAASACPASTLYDVEPLLPQLAVGEALVSVVSPAGTPTEPAWTRLYPPETSLGPPSGSGARSTAHRVATAASAPVLPTPGDPEELAGNLGRSAELAG